MFYTICDINSHKLPDAYIKRVCRLRGYEYITEGMFYTDMPLAILPNSAYKFYPIPRQCFLASPLRSVVITRLLEILQKPFHLFSVFGNFAFIQINNQYAVVDLLRSTVYVCEDDKEPMRFITYGFTNDWDAQIREFTEPKLANIIGAQFDDTIYVFDINTDSLIYKLHISKDHIVSVMSFSTEADDWQKQYECSATCDALLILDFCITMAQELS